MKSNINKAKEVSWLINIKLKYPIINREILVKDKIRFVKKIDLFELSSMWCKWSLPALKGLILFIILIKFIDKNS